MRQFIVVLLLGLYSSIWAQEFLPKGCHALPLGDDVQFMPKKDHLLFVHSLSPHEIWLANVKQQRMTTSVVPGLWSVFYAPKFESSWRCIQSEPGHEQKVACHEVLAVCEWPIQSPNAQLKRLNAWIAYNMRFSEISAYLQRTGWQLKIDSKSQ